MAYSAILHIVPGRLVEEGGSGVLGGGSGGGTEARRVAQRWPETVRGHCGPGTLFRCPGLEGG